MSKVEYMSLALLSKREKLHKLITNNKEGEVTKRGIDNKEGEVT